MYNSTIVSIGPISYPLWYGTLKSIIIIIIIIISKAPFFGRYPCHCAAVKTADSAYIHNI